MEGGEVGAQLAPPAFVQSLFHEPHPAAAAIRKRNHSQPRQPPASGDKNPNSDWDPRMWQWDSLRFSAKPSEAALVAVADSSARNPCRDAAAERAKVGCDVNAAENLSLKLGGVANLTTEEARPSKKLCSSPPTGSSGGGGAAGNFPMCQVDDCHADLSDSKDYHRRHKVCQAHSKTTNALVGKQMQRFCQQCSRFHPLSEFDEGKRSCRRRLAGHNRRRRKTPQEVDSSQSLPVGTRENDAKGSPDIVHLFSLLERLRGNAAEKLPTDPSLPERERLVEIISKFKPLPNETSPSKQPKLPPGGSLDLNLLQPSQQHTEQLPGVEGSNASPLTMDLLAVLSETLSDQPRWRNDGSAADDKAKCLELMECQPPEVRSCLPLQLFSSTDDDSPPKFGSLRKYLSSESSNPVEVFPSASPVAKRLFPLHSGEINKHERQPFSREDNTMLEASTSRNWNPQPGPFMESDGPIGNVLGSNLRSQAGYISSSGSDHSPSSSNSDVQDRTGRIIFKLFDKDPHSIPVTLRSQIMNWLSRSPLEIESYIRPGCMVLSVYLSMPSILWDELEENLYEQVAALLKYSESEFWRRGRFLVRTNRRIVSHKDGKIHVCRTSKTWNTPDLTLVSPIALVSGQETTLILRGRNLNVPGTKIHCTYMGGYISKDVRGCVYPGDMCDDIHSVSFIFPRDSSNIFGRCFIEVEKGFKGNYFPLIFADLAICQELRSLEIEIGGYGRTLKNHRDEQFMCYEQPRIREDVLHFLNELGWLFQRKSQDTRSFFHCFDVSRYKYLLTFSVERDWIALVKKLLDTLVERSATSDELIHEYLEMLSEVHLLSRAVKRKCRGMVYLLLRYSVKRNTDSPMLLFPSNFAGPGGQTPLHLVASIHGAEEIVDALTSYPQEAGLEDWSSMFDDNGHAPCSYASTRSNHLYNELVARKLVDWKNRQISMTIRDEGASVAANALEEAQQGDAEKIRRRPPLQARSCDRCAVAASAVRPFAGTRGLLSRSFVHTLLAIAAVCVCVCLFYRGRPSMGCGKKPLVWEKVEYGPR